MGITHQWQREPGPRLQGSRPLDSSKLQAPCITPNPSGGFRLFYTAVGPEKPFRACQGYILSAVSDDGLKFRKEPGIRVAPQPDLPHLCLRVLAPTITQCADGRWRMYFEARGAADRPTVICSAVSSDMLHWEHEEGIRLQSDGGVGGPRYLPLPEGRGRLYCFNSEFGPGGPASGQRLSQGVVSALSSDGLDFDLEPGYRMQSGQTEYDAVGITAAEVIPPKGAGNPWTMIFSAWQDVPPGTVVPMHPSQDPNAVAKGLSDDFATASIASDLAGYRSRIFVAYSTDGLVWERGGCAIDGEGYDGEGLDAVHAEDMSLIEIDENRFRMYYAACDNKRSWRIASAVTPDPAATA